MRFSASWLPPALALLLIPRSGPAAGAALADYLPPDTKLVLGIVVRPAIATLAQGLGPELLAQASALLAQTPLAGFDPLKDLDEVLIATSGKGNNPPALAVLRGRFDVERLGRNAAWYRDALMLKGAVGQDGVLALLDSSTALAGDAALVRAAIDRRGQGADTVPAWAARIDELRGRYIVWGIGEGLEGLPGQPVAPGGMDSLDRFEFGVAFAHGMELTAELHFRSPQDADKLNAFLSLVQAAPQAGGARFDMQSLNGTLRFSVAVPEEELKKQMAAFQRGFQQSAALSPFGGKPAAASKPPAPPEGKIVTGSQGDTLTVTLPGKR